MMKLPMFFLFALGAVAVHALSFTAGRGDDSASSSLPDYLIVGAGGAGLQLALYLEKFGLSYQILEKRDIVASHFATFPRFDELISLNKWVRNETQAMRYGKKQKRRV